MPKRPLQRLLSARPLTLLSVLIAWVPLVLLADNRHLLLRDQTAYGRFFVALPVLAVARLLLGGRMQEGMEYIREAGIVRPEDRDSYLRLQHRIGSLNGSWIARLSFLALAYLISLLTIGRQLAISFPSWARVAESEGFALSASGWWLELVSLPLFWYAVVRMVWRFLVWAAFLWRLARYRLQMDAAHPDRLGGLGFLSGVQGDFAFVIFALGVVASTVASQRISDGVAAPGGSADVAVAYIVIATVVVVLPLGVFIPHLRDLRWYGELAHGHFAHRYVRAFARRWLRRDAPDDAQLLGTQDVQALGDLMNAFDTVRGVRPFPITREALLLIVAGAALSMVPLLLATVPLKAILSILAKAILRG